MPKRVRGSKSSVKVEIEPQPDPEEKEGFGGLIEAARRKASGEDPKVEKADEEVKEAPDIPAMIEDASLIIVPLVVASVTYTIGAWAEPEDEEADAFVKPLLRIMFRHLPVKEAPEDVWDALAALGAVGMWYMRIRPELKARSAQPNVIKPDEEVEEAPNERDNGSLDGRNRAGRSILFAGSGLSG